jgi:hypothetical protein
MKHLLLFVLPASLLMSNGVIVHLDNPDVRDYEVIRDILVINYANDGIL